jgi:hypothetical protein
MSHAYGEVIKDGKVLAFFEYDGTSDIAISCLHNTEAELQAQWRSGVWNECTCGQPGSDVLLYTNYGRGCFWPGKVCLACRAITGGRDPYADNVETTNGHPIDGQAH